MTMLQPRVLPERGRYRPRNVRRIACVFPRYTPSFGTFQHAYPLIPGVKAFMPPQGLLLIAAYLPERWEVRFIDENVRRATDADLRWADAVFISGMHVQRRQIVSINARAHDAGKVTVLGGPSVSASPDYYPDLDILHLGEIGDATESLIQRLDRTCERPRQQLIFETTDRLPLTRFPTPAYHMVNLRHYLLASVQFSSGCPFRCEFCDIPALYGRNPRLKSPEQVCRELDAIVAAGATGAVYFVDDNFIANRNATRALLPRLIDWQKRNRYPLKLSCEATLDLAQQPAILEQMREANFDTVFCGIETPETDALASMRKKQNLRQPILDAVATLNSYGLEVVSGIILGLDTDTRDTADRVLAFIEESGIPMLTINLLYALPKTALYDRLKAQGRLVNEPGRASNVRFKLPYEQVHAMWLRCISEAYEPDNLYRRFARQAATTFTRRPDHPRRVTLRDVVFGVRIMSRVLWHVGLKADYRRAFWRTAWPLIKVGRIEEVIHIGFVSHHLIRFTRDCQRGGDEACFYADPAQATARHTPVAAS
jgi:radical SAM superfamily enzyme YgiQ (UPF0313 family)